ncbi:hypothetical protein FDP41_013756 [Naegleria fowleri]|uniref:HMG box domain-containing protein n=1 Tax=Naegleria fowleri TaxID=5763 RepID=A0A6A5C173_NAEFO|nr:uncharacterized protein FDP41_013756 [Naegleria fowleri]KAF0980542.1 hypothetical protein FDP41_013756 [Naegleria fowleri]
MNTLASPSTQSIKSNFNNYHAFNNHQIALVPTSQYQQQQLNEGSSSSTTIVTHRSHHDEPNIPTTSTNNSAKAAPNHHHHQQQRGNSLPSFGEHLRLLNQVQQSIMMNQQQKQQKLVMNDAVVASATNINTGGMEMASSMMNHDNHQCAQNTMTSHSEFTNSMNALLLSQQYLLNQQQEQHQFALQQSSSSIMQIPSCQHHGLSPKLPQQQIITYHSVEGCIVDENKIFGPINVLNADETKQTKIVVMPTSVFQRFLEPILEHIKQALFTPLQQPSLVSVLHPLTSLAQPPSFIGTFPQQMHSHSSGLNLKLVVNSDDLEPFIIQQQPSSSYDNIFMNCHSSNANEVLSQSQYHNANMLLVDSIQHHHNNEPLLTGSSRSSENMKDLSERLEQDEDCSIIFEESNQDVTSSCQTSSETCNAVCSSGDSHTKDNTQQQQGNTTNNYKKTNNKKGIKKKRKYIKSGLFRKDPKSGQFLFSSRDRARLATLITPHEHATGSSSNIATNTTLHEGNVNTPMESQQCSISNNNDSIALFGGNSSTSGSIDQHHSNSSSPHTSTLSSEYSNGTDEHDRLAFELYCSETVPIHKDTASNMILLREQWRLLPHEERERYKRSVVVMSTLENSNAGDGTLMTNVDYIEEFSEKDNSNSLVGKYSRLKRPLNAYNIFCKTHFPEFQQQYPDCTINQISKYIGEKWKSLSKEERQPYIDQSKKNSQPVVKKPLSAYNIFCKSQFEIFKKKYPDLNIHLLSRKVADSWKSLSEDEKRIYYEGAQKQRQENLIQVHNMIPTLAKQ